jgi:hypothetical protein
VLKIGVVADMGELEGRSGSWIDWDTRGMEPAVEVVGCDLLGIGNTDPGRQDMTVAAATEKGHNIAHPCMDMSCSSDEAHSRVMHKGDGSVDGVVGLTRRKSSHDFDLSVQGGLGVCLHGMYECNIFYRLSCFRRNGIMQASHWEVSGLRELRSETYPLVPMY